MQVKISTSAFAFEEISVRGLHGLGKDYAIAKSTDILQYLKSMLTVNEFTYVHLMTCVREL